MFTHKNHCERTFFTCRTKARWKLIKIFPFLILELIEVTFPWTEKPAGKNEGNQSLTHCWILDPTTHEALSQKIQCQPPHYGRHQHYSTVQTLICLGWRFSPSGTESIFLKHTPARLLRIICCHSTEEKIKFFQTAPKNMPHVGQAWGAAVVLSKCAKAVCELTLPLAVRPHPSAYGHTFLPITPAKDQCRGAGCISLDVSSPSAQHKHRLPDIPWRFAHTQSGPGLISMFLVPSTKVMLHCRHQTLVCDFCPDSSQTPAKQDFQEKKKKHNNNYWLLSHL